MKSVPSPITRLLQISLSLLLVVGGLWLLPSSACAGDWGIGLLAQAEEGSGEVADTFAPQKSYIFEVFLVVVLFGAALFAVCRTSRRA